MSQKAKWEIGDKYQRLIRDFTEVINRNSLENGSNTPDYILARMLVEFLATYNDTVQLKEEWHKPKPEAEFCNCGCHKYYKFKRTCCDRGEGRGI